MSLVVQQLSTATLGGITAAMHAPLFPTEHLGKVHTHTHHPGQKHPPDSG